MHALTLIQSSDGVHLVGSQFKVKDLLVGLDPGLMNRLWEDDDAFLVFKAQDHLANILAILLSNVNQDWFVK